LVYPKPGKEERKFPEKQLVNQPGAAEPKQLLKKRRVKKQRVEEVGLLQAAPPALAGKQQAVAEAEPLDVPLKVPEEEGRPQSLQAAKAPVAAAKVPDLQLGHKD
jgi:hypothetical protein